MSFGIDGYLSTDMTEWIAKHRRNCSRWFELANRLNGVAQGMIRSMIVQSDDNAAFVATLLFLRGVSSFQGAILLSERGMTQEARTIARSCFETMFYLGALQNDAKFLDDIIGEDAAQRSKIARALIELPDEHSLDQARIDILRTFVLAIKQSQVTAKPIGIQLAAKRAGLDSVYDTYYRGLSNDSSHPTLVAMERYTDKARTGEIIGLKWSPDANDVDDTVSAACTAGIYLIVFALKFLGLKDMPADLDEIWERYKELIDEAEPPTAN